MIACNLLEDEELLRLVQQDNEPAFHELYLRYWSKLFFLAHKRLKSAAAAEDIVQDVFLILWQKRKELAIESLPPYLAAMTRYAVYRSLSREKRSEWQMGIAGKPLTKTLSGENVIENKLILEMVKKLTCKLPEKCRLVFIYNKIEDQALTEVAQKMNISIKTAEAHLTKALRIIRMNLGDILVWIIQFLPLIFLH